MVVENLLNQKVTNKFFWHKKCLIIATMTYFLYHPTTFPDFEKRQEIRF